MRVTMEHREEIAGIRRDRINYFVDCTVQFSEEEKAIVRIRKLEHQFFSVGPPNPDLLLSEILKLDIVRGIAKLSYFTAIPYGIIGFLNGWRSSGDIATLMLLGGIIVDIAGFFFLLLQKNKSKKATNEQNISIQKLLEGPFSVYAPNIPAVEEIEQDITNNLRAIKNLLTGSLEQPSRRSVTL